MGRRLSLPINKGETMLKIIPTDKLEVILLKTFSGRSVSIQPNAAWEDKPFVQEINEYDGVKEYLEGLEKDGLIKFVKDENKIVTKAELIQYANEKFDAGWDEKTYKKKKVVELEALIEELENPSETTDDDDSDEQDESETTDDD